MKGLANFRPRYVVERSGDVDVIVAVLKQSSRPSRILNRGRRTHRAAGNPATADSDKSEVDRDLI